jgi:hypothetical protein
MPLGGPTELAHYSSTALATTHTTATASSGTNAGDLIVITGTLDGWTASSVSDSVGNTYTRSVNFSQGGGTSAVLAWTIVTTPTTTSTTFSLTASGSAGCNLSVQAYTGLAAGQPDQAASAGISTGTDLNSGNTSALNGTDDLLVGVDALNASTLTVTPEVLSPAWTGVTTNPLTNTTSGVRRLYTFWREQTGGGTPRFDVTTSATITSAAAGIVAFQVSGPPAVPPAYQPRRMPLGV